MCLGFAFGGVGGFENPVARESEKGCLEIRQVKFSNWRRNATKLEA
jgi:hypothetical protein